MAFTYILCFAVTVGAADSYIIQDTTIPLADYPNQGHSYGRDRCWAFAKMVYETIWGQTFPPARGTADNILRDIGTGSIRAITPENTKNFIKDTALGAIIRISDNVTGDDFSGNEMHSQILVQKDADGLTVYESISTMVRMRYYTWQEYAEKYAKYEYFKYIIFPNPLENVGASFAYTSGNNEIKLDFETGKNDENRNFQKISVKNIVAFDEWSSLLFDGTAFFGVII